MSRLPDDTFPLDKVSAELNRVFAQVHMNEPVQSLLVVHGVPLNGNEFFDLCPDPHGQQKELKTNPELLRRHTGTRLRWRQW